MSEKALLENYLVCRRKTVELCEPLEVEDYGVQPVSEVSPPKWHLAHTTWFYEEMILVPQLVGYRRFNDEYRPLFNSYYKSQGSHWNQGQRGELSRPTVAEVRDYRQHVDTAVTEFLSQNGSDDKTDFLFQLGRQHEEQHQELLLMDIKSILAANPLPTRYCDQPLPQSPLAVPEWKAFPEGIYHVGFDGDGFAFDNERRRHKQYLYPFAISSTLATNADYLAFIDDGGYRRSELWLSLGWEWVQRTKTTSPLYWKNIDGSWYEYTLHGSRALQLQAPVAHVNFFEADAFARWRGARLPSEFEYEVFLGGEQAAPPAPTFHPFDARAPRGQLWAWTGSAYRPYPGFRAFRGAAEEYNGKFMCNQFVLKGGCVATPVDHHRDTYRNFYLPEQRWMFSGIRLAKEMQ